MTNNAKPARQRAHMTGSIARFARPGHADFWWTIPLHTPWKERASA